MAKSKVGSLPYTVERTDPHVLTIRFNGDIRAGWTSEFLMSTDRHWDNPESNRRMQIRHLEEARKKNAGVFDAGDLFCVMQGRDDKRGNKSGLRPEHNNIAYFDSVVKDAAKWFAPWADLFVQCSPGNHESAVLKRHETDITANFVERLNDDGKGNCQVGKYCGWVRFLFTMRKTVKKSVRMFYHHGWGGGGPVTRGVIDTNRMAVYLPDADLVWTGHTHDSWYLPIARDRLSDKGKPYIDEAIHFRTPGFKDEYSPREGYHLEKGRGPKPLGAAWLKFYCEDETIKWDVTRAR